MYRIFTILVLLGVISGMAYFGKIQYDRMTKTMAQMEVSLLQSQDTIKQLQKEREVFEEATRAYQRDLNKWENDRDRLIGVLQRHDLTRLVIAKPGLVEKRINDGIEQVWKDFERASGKSDTG